MSSSPSEGRSLLSTRENLRPDPSPLSTRSANASNKKSSSKNALKAPAVALDFSDDENEDQLNGDENGDFGDSFDIGNDTMAGEHEMSDSPAPQNNPDGNSSLMEVGSRRTEKAAPARTSSASKAEPKKRGRPRKTQRPVDEEVADLRPSKKPKTAASAPQRAHEPLDPELDRVVENYATRTGPLKGRSLYILKREIPTENSGTHTRSGRVSVRPLAYWRNERCVYGDGEAVEGQRYPLSTIKEVIRTEELEPEKQKKKGKRAGRKAKSRKSKNDSSDEEDENADVWEKEGGVLHGYVRKWDADLQAGSTEEEVLGMLLLMMRFCLHADS
jgi:centromere protein C